MSKQRFEMIEGGASKFWEIELVGSELHIAWGKIGTAGQSQVKSFGDEAAARAQEAKLVKEKTGKGYVAAGETVARAPIAADVGATKLSYVIADFDAEDTIAFDVTREGAGYRVVCDATRELVTAEALETRNGIWVIGQGARTPAHVDDTRLPPFLVSRALREALALGACTLTTGWDEGRELTLRAAPIDELDEAADALSKWKGPKLCARDDAGTELVIADAEVPQLLYFRVDDTCTIEWQSGVLEGATKKAAKAKAKKPTAKRPTPMQVLAQPDASQQDRITALRALGVAASDEAIRVLVTYALDADEKIEGQASQALSAALSARSMKQQPADPIPLLQSMLAATKDAPIPELGAGTTTAWWAWHALLQHAAHDGREDARAILREIAWRSLRGPVSIEARRLLVSLSDADALERVSQQLLDARFADIAAIALTRLGGAGLERARAQLAQTEGQSRNAATLSLLRAVDDCKPGTIDGTAWWALIGPTLTVLAASNPPLRGMCDGFRAKHGVSRQIFPQQT